MKKVFGFINNYKWSFIILPIVVILIVSIAMTYALPDKEIRLLTDSDIGYCTDVAQLAEEINPENLPNVIKAVTAPLTLSSTNLVVKRSVGHSGWQEMYEPLSKENYYIDVKANVTNAKNIEVFVFGNLKGRQTKIFLNNVFKIDVTEDNNEINVNITKVEISTYSFVMKEDLSMISGAIKFFIRIS